MNKEYIIYFFNKNPHYEIIEEIEGRISKIGKSANIEKNRIYKIKDNVNNEEFALMYCDKKSFTKISFTSIEKIKSFNHTWYLLKNGYIGTHYNNSICYIHRFLLDNYRRDHKKDISICHINKDKLDNRIFNLTDISDKSFNNKRVRRYNSKNLPKELENIILPIYSYYCYEYVNKGKDNEYKREYFRIEHHPNQDKRWSSSKSIKYSILDKFNQTIDKMKELDNINIE